MSKRSTISTLSAAVLLLTGLEGAFAQDQGNAVRAVVGEERLVYVYHTVDMPLGYGFRLYRDGVPLHSDPVYSVDNGDAFRMAMGPEFQKMAASVGETSPAGVLLQLRTDRVMGSLATFLYPSAAAALGRLYIDSTATIGSIYNYRFEILDNDGDRTGVVVESNRQVDLWPIQIPSNLRGISVGRSVRLDWQYPMAPSGRELDDPVIRFEVYRETADGAESLTRTPVLRNAAVDTFATVIEAAAVGSVERYFIRAIDVTGRLGPKSETLEFFVRDTEPPHVVPAVHARSLGRNTVEVQWAASPSQDVASYFILRADRGDDRAVYDTLATRPARQQGLRFVDGDADGTGGQGYFYSIVATDSSGNASPMSSPAMALVYDENPPQPVANLRAEYRPNLDAVQVTWQMTEQPIDFQSFLVFRQRLDEGSAPGEAMLNEGDLRDTVLVDYGPDSLGFGEDELYRWSVMSADSTRNFSDSTVVEYRIPNVHPPAAPSDLIATILDGRAVQLSWVGSPDLDVWKYKVYRSGEAPSDSLVDTTFSIRTSYLDEAVEPVRTYVYRVTALDDAGNESLASDSVEIEMLDANPPRSVRNVRARIDSTGTVTVSWEPVIASDLAGYVIYKASHRTAPYSQVLEVDASQTTWIDDAGQSGDWYRVRSIDTSSNLSEPGTAAPVTVSPIGAQR